MFRGYCAKGHDRINFDGQPEAFEDHMTKVHGARRLRPGGPGALGRTAPGWGHARQGLPKPHQWAAPKPTTGAHARMVEAAQDGLLEFTDASGTYGRRAGLAEWREARWSV